MAQSKQLSNYDIGTHAVLRDWKEFWPHVIQHVHFHIYGRDEAVVHHGDSARNLIIVLKGWVKLSRQTPNGQEVIVGLCTDGDIFGEASFFQNANYPYNADVISESAELLAIPSAMIKELIQKDPTAARSVMNMLNEKAFETQLKLEHMSTLSTAQRLGCFLLHLCEKKVEGEKTIQIPVKKNIIAGYLGMKPETFSRSQNQLREIGVESNGQGVNIQDIEKLREFVCGSCSESGMCENDPEAKP